jgi:hypothetical protein
MKPETKILLLLVFIPPVLGELLSGSSPPLEFFTPFGFVVIVTFYGGGTLLIREAKARWNLQWSVGFLAVAYGILEEGTMMQLFFNFNHIVLGLMSRYGMYLGVQWPWTLALILYHATISTLIPITMVELLWPQHKSTPLLKKKGLILTFLGVIAVTVLLMNVVWMQQAEYSIPYVPDPVMLLGSIVVILLLIWLAFYFRKSSISTHTLPLLHPFVFAVFGFFLHLGNLFIPSILAENQVNGAITILVQCIGIIFVLMFVKYQLLHQDIKRNHVVSFVFGSILFWIVLTPIQEFINGSFGMFTVGAISFVLLVYWRHVVLKKKNFNITISG